MATRKVQAVQEQRIDDLKDYVGDRLDQMVESQKSQFDIVIKGLERMSDRFEEHAKDDKHQFASIENSFKNLEVAAAKTKGEVVQAAKDKGKLWGVITGLTSTGLAGGIWESLKFLHLIK